MKKVKEYLNANKRQTVTKDASIMESIRIRFSLIVLIIFIISLVGCSNQTSIKRNLLYTDCQADHLSRETPLTDFFDLYPETVSYNEILLGYLTESITPSNEFIELYDGELAVTNLTPQYSKLYFSVLTQEDAKDVEVTLQYDTGVKESIVIPLVRKNNLVRVSVNLPENAKSVQLVGYTMQETKIAVGECYDLSDANQKKFERVSNNTIKFNCDETHFLIYDKYGDIVDDVTLNGHGTFVTANAAAMLLEVKNDSNIIAQ